eukprot:gnl/MRDRNA2_/MRDRNA2_34692_c0_seq1.p1 gnl/MRDRNA2_/MRDRNA2_34692_c0~~gnl/MRDRNA2_/MRDRNA2_34692_c0_seq1.p1  ORF type:complete len:136 (+),score=15.43 gnl/MRDRNA2_/MRDRNA2_34692_c0_seq1:281-688(+)
MILFPCNQFLGQEPGAPPDSQSLKRMSTYNFTDSAIGSGNVIVTEKVEVNGDNTHPVFQFLKYNSSLYSESKGLVTPIPWNFSKFLVEPAGGVYKYYSPNVNPKGLIEDIDLLMSADSPKSPTRRKTIELDSSRS